MRLASGWKAGLAVLLPTLGVFFGARASIAAYYTIPGSVTIASAVAIIVLAFVVAYLRGIVKMLPDTLIDEVGSDGPYRSELATTESLREACEMTRPYYGREYVGHELAEQWRLANPRVFECIFNGKGELCASFGVLPLEDGFTRLFLEGRVDDLKLKASDILSGESAKKCPRLYISGVVVREPGKFAGSKRARVMLWVMLQHVKREYGLGQSRELFAIAVTKESAKLMCNLKFQLIADGKARIDKCALYQYKLTSETWQNLLCEVWDCSGLCTIDVGGS